MAKISTLSNKNKLKSTDSKTNEELLREQLMTSADNRSGATSTYILDQEKEREKEFLLKYSSNNPIRRIISEHIRPYLKKFPMEFYELIYKLQGWPTDGKKLFNRPSVVGKYTNQVIYYRFAPGTLQILQSRNPYIGKGRRLHKHFQLLTPEAEVDLLLYINQAISLMKQSTGWDHFMSLLAQQYGHPYQTAMVLK